MSDLILLPVFAALFATTHILEKHLGKAHASRWRVVAITAAVLAHPISVEVYKNFLVHVVVYSGYILKLH